MTDIVAETGQRPSVFTLVIRSKAALYAAWMPLIRGGGIFLPSNRAHLLGEPLSPATVVGAALVLVGVWLGAIRGSP